MKLYFIPVLFLLTISAKIHAETGKPILRLWYNQPADEWMKSTPVGNGRLGAMIFGGINNDRVALNEITLWAGQPDPNQELPCGKEKLAGIRKLFFDGKIKEGNDSAVKYLSGRPNTFGTHIPVGDLNLGFSFDENKATEYKRELNLENAITTVSFKIEDIVYKREYFCSNPDNILIIKLSADKKNAINCSVSLDLLSKSVISASKDHLEFTGKATSTLKVRNFPDFSKGGVDFMGIVNASVTGGSTESSDGRLIIKDAENVILTIDIRTSYNNPAFKELCKETIEHAISQKYERLKESHIKDYTNLSQSC